jgi:hypothetical protein
MSFTRSRVETDSHVLYYWMPDELRHQAAAVSQSVLGALMARL